MIVLLLFLVPLVGGLLAFFLKDQKVVKSWSLFVSLVLLVLSVAGIAWVKDADQLSFSANWMSTLGSRFSLAYDGLSQILCLLTAVAYPLIILGTWKTEYRRPNHFFGLLLLTQAGLIGVFTATDALPF